MTQHTLNDLVFDGELFDPAQCVHEDYPDFRGLTCCQAGTALQAAWAENLPAIREVVKFLAESREPKPRAVTKSLAKLREFLAVEF